MSVRLRQIAVTMLAALLGVSWSAAALHTHSHADHGSAHECGATGCGVHQHAAVRHTHSHSHAGHSHHGHTHGGAASHGEAAEECDPHAKSSEAPQPEPSHEGCVVCEFLAQPPLPTVTVVLPALTETVQKAVLPARPAAMRVFVSLFESRGPPVA